MVRTCVGMSLARHVRHTYNVGAFLRLVNQFDVFNLCFHTAKGMTHHDECQIRQHACIYENHDDAIMTCSFIVFKNCSITRHIS